MTGGGAQAKPGFGLHGRRGRGASGATGWDQGKPELELPISCPPVAGARVEGPSQARARATRLSGQIL